MTDTEETTRTETTDGIVRREIEWHTKGAPKTGALQLVCVRGKRSGLISSFAMVYEEAGWTHDDGDPMCIDDWTVVAWADMPKLR